MVTVRPLPPGAGNTHCPLVFLPLDGGGLGGGELLPHLYGKYFPVCVHRTGSEDEPLHHDGGWSPSSFLQNSVRNLSHGFLLCTEASSVNCTRQNNALSHQHISFVTNIVHYKRNNRQKG